MRLLVAGHGMFNIMKNKIMTNRTDKITDIEPTIRRRDLQKVVNEEDMGELYKNLLIEI